MPYAQLPDFRMHYLVSGDGDRVIVFVHGFISSHRWWLPTLERLPRQDYRAYAIDLRAAGESEPVERGHTLAQYAEDLHQWTKAVGLSRFTLVGHSMGGGVAMHYALHHPETLQALVLVDPLAAHGTRLTPEVTAWINAQQGNVEGVRPIVLGAFATPPTGAYLETLVQDAAGWGAAIYRGTMDDMARFDVVSQLPSIKVPALVTWGDKDTVIPFDAIAEIFTSIPGCALEVWHGVGHSGPIEIPDRFVSLLTRFIDEVGSSQEST